MLIGPLRAEDYSNKTSLDKPQSGLMLGSSRMVFEKSGRIEKEKKMTASELLKSVGAKIGIKTKMSATELAKVFGSTMDTGDFSKLESYLDDGFIFSGPTPNPLNKQEFLGFHRSLKAAFPDWNTNVVVLEDRGDSVRATASPSGTHRATLILKDIGSYEATNRSFRLPPEPLLLSVKNNKITSIVITPTAGGGVMGILSQLGLSVSH